MFDTFHDHEDNGETLRACLRSAYDRQRPPLMPRRMAELLETLRQVERDKG